MNDDIQAKIDKVETLSKALNNSINDSVKKMTEVAKSNDIAFMYTIKNMDNIKFVLSGIPAVDRHDVVHAHLGELFKTYDHKQIDNLLFKNGIFKLNFIKWSHPIIWFIFLFAFIINIYSNPYEFIPMLTTLAGYTSALFVTIYFNNMIAHSKFLTYRLSEDFKNMPRPDDIGWFI